MADSSQTKSRLCFGVCVNLPGLLLSGDLRASFTCLVSSEIFTGRSSAASAPLTVCEGDMEPGGGWSNGTEWVGDRSGGAEADWLCDASVDDARRDVFELCATEAVGKDAEASDDWLDAFELVVDWLSSIWLDDILLDSEWSGRISAGVLLFGAVLVGDWLDFVVVLVGGWLGSVFIACDWLGIFFFVGDCLVATCLGEVFFVGWLGDIFLVNDWLGGVSLVGTVLAGDWLGGAVLLDGWRARSVGCGWLIGIVLVGDWLAVTVLPDNFLAIAILVGDWLTNFFVTVDWLAETMLFKG